MIEPGQKYRDKNFPKVVITVTKIDTEKKRVHYNADLYGRLLNDCSETYEAITKNYVRTT